MIRPKQRLVRPVRSVQLLAALLAVATAPTMLAACDKPESTQLKEKPLPHVRVAPVQWVEPRPQSRHLSPLEPYRRARLSPRTGGQVIELSADEEQVAKAGDVLVRFAAEDPRGGLITAKASIRRIQENIRDTDRELRDANALVAQGVGTSREVEQLKTKKATLSAQLREGKGRLVRARDRVGAAVLVAPFDGTITSVATELGEYLGPGGVAVVLAQLDPMAVSVALTQPEAERADAEGLSFKVHARGKELPAELEWISSEAVGTSGTFTARVKIPNPDMKLRGGELVDVDVFGARGARATAVPFTAIRWAGEVAYVLKLVDGRLERLDVEVRDETEELVIISGQVEVGDKVVSTGPTALMPGDEVVVVEGPAQTVAAR